jgi:hypothetical protein
MENLLIAFHNSLLIVLLDVGEQNILVFDEEWVGRLLDLPTIDVVERKFDVPDLEISLQAPSVRLS